MFPHNFPAGIINIRLLSALAQTENRYPFHVQYDPFHGDFRNDIRPDTAEKQIKTAVQKIFRFPQYTRIFMRSDRKNGGSLKNRRRINLYDPPVR